MKKFLKKAVEGFVPNGHFGTTELFAGIYVSTGVNYYINADTKFKEIIMKNLTNFINNVYLSRNDFYYRETIDTEYGKVYISLPVREQGNIFICLSWEE